jgi:hypothetical protein
MMSHRVLQPLLALLAVPLLSSLLCAARADDSNDTISMQRHVRQQTLRPRSRSAHPPSASHCLPLLCAQAVAAPLRARWLV